MLRNHQPRRLLAAFAAALALVGLILSPAGASPLAMNGHQTVPKPAKARIRLRVRLPFPLPARAVAPSCGAAQRTTAWLVSTSPRPRPLRLPRIAYPLAAHRINVLPLVGKGVWITDFPGDRVRIARDVSLASKDGIDQLWVRVGSTHDGFYGGAILRALVPLAHARHISVIAWDFPTLANPAIDARRARLAFQSGADAFSPDIETPAEGTYLSVARVTQYLARVRSYAGRRAVVATVPQPSLDRLATYPYAAEAPYIDAFAPMVYWSCTEPGAAVANSMKVLSQLRPVLPIGQDYNMASEGGRHGLPSGQEIWRFLDVAHRDGAIGASLYDLESGGPVQLHSLAAYPW